MSRYVLALKLAFSLLSIFPVGRFKEFSEVEYRRAEKISPVFYPLVGAAFSLVLLAFHLLLSFVFPDVALLHAALLLAGWVVLSGGLHLDGLCDSIDALYAAHRRPEDRERTLRIMREPTSGPMANIALFFCLSLKCICLFYLLNTDVVWAVGLSVVCARYVAMVTMQCLPYARSSGIAERMNTAPQWRSLTLASLLFIAFSACVVVYSALGWFQVSIVLLLSVLVSIVWQQRWKTLVGGYTGDTLGAQIEIIELISLMYFCSLL